MAPQPTSNDIPLVVAIRPATLSDLEAFREFEQGIVAAERPFDPTLQQGNHLLRPQNTNPSRRFLSAGSPN